MRSVGPQGWLKLGNFIAGQSLYELYFSVHANKITKLLLYYFGRCAYFEKITCLTYKMTLWDARNLQQLFRGGKTKGRNATLHKAKTR